MQIDPKHLWKLETGWGGINVTLATLVRVAEAFEVGVGNLFSAEGARVSRAKRRASGAMAGGERHVPSPELVASPRETEKYRQYVPLFSLKAAAGAFGSVQVVEPLGWVQPGTRHRLRPGMFVAQVIGRSMEPRIPGGSYCLFSSPVTGSRQGRIVLVQHRAIRDPETAASYTVKRYESETVYDEDGTWRRRLIRLVPLNRDYEPIVLKGVSDDEVEVVAELLEVLWSA